MSRGKPVRPKFINNNCKFSFHFIWFDFVAPHSFRFCEYTYLLWIAATWNWNLFISCARAFAIVSQLVFHFRILIKLARAAALPLTYSPLPSSGLAVVCDIIKLPAEELLCRAQVAKLEDLLRAWQSSKWLEMGYKLLVYSELCKISERWQGIFEKWRRPWVMKWVTQFGSKTSRTLCYLSEWTPPPSLFALQLNSQSAF